MTNRFIHKEVSFNKALKMLGFIKYHIRQFNNVYALRSLYNARIRNHLKCNSVIWPPFYNIHIKASTKKFLCYIAFKLFIPSEEINYSNLLSMFQLKILLERHQCFDRKFLSKIIHGVVQCPEILSQLNLNVPKRCLLLFYNNIVQFMVNI